MGKCLSKQSKKAKDVEDEDRLPYTPSQRPKRHSAPIPISGAPAHEKNQATETPDFKPKQDNRHGKSPDSVVKLPLDTAVHKPLTVTADKREEVFREPAVRLPTDSSVHKPETITEPWVKLSADSAVHKPRIQTATKPNETLSEPAVRLPVEGAVHKPSTHTVTKPNETLSEPAVRLPVEGAVHKPSTHTATKPNERLSETAVRLPLEGAVHKPSTHTATKPNERLSEQAVRLPVEGAVHKPSTHTATKPNERLSEPAVRLPVEGAVHKSNINNAIKPNEKLSEPAVRLPLESAVYKPLSFTAEEPKETISEPVIRLPIESATHKPLAGSAIKSKEKLDEPISKLSLDSAIHKPVTLTANKPNERLDSAGHKPITLNAATTNEKLEEPVVRLSLDGAVHKPLTLTANKSNEKLAEPVVKLPVETAVNKPLKAEDIDVKIEPKVEARSPTVKSSFQSSVTSTFTNISDDGVSKPEVQTTSRSVFSEQSNAHVVTEDPQTFSGGAKPDISVFSKTAPISFNKKDLGNMSVKEIRQRTSQTETKRETTVSTSSSSESQEPMALIGALKYLKSPDAHSETVTTITTTKVNGDVKTIVNTATSANVDLAVNGQMQLSPEVADQKPSLYTSTSYDSQGTPKISNIPVSKTRAPSSSISTSSETSPAKPVNGTAASASESSDVFTKDMPASESSETANSTTDVTSPGSEEGDEVFDEHFKKEPANPKRDYLELFHDFSQYNDDIVRKHPLLAGTRTKQLQQIAKGLQSSTDSKVLVVTGVGGVGKTCLAAEVCIKYSSQLAGYHIFRYNSPNVHHNRLRDVLMSLAHHFCDVFPNYISILPRVEKLRELIKKDDLPELYNVLFFYPLTNEALQRSSEEQMLIVIDALDECDPQDIGVLTDVVNNLNESCPEWLYVLVTCRADGSIADKILNANKIEIKRKESDNMSDIKRYLKEPLAQFMDRISLDGGLTSLTKKTQGSFTCAEVYKNRLASLPTDTKIAMREVDGLYLDGLEANCLELLKCYKERIPVDKSTKNAYTAITSVIACAREPLSVEFIFDLVGAKYFEQCKEALREISPLLCYDNEKVEFINHCIVEWLFDEKAGEFRLDREVGRQELATMCAKWITGILDGDLELDPSLKAYALKHSVYHLTDVRGNCDVIGKILCSLKYAREKLSLPGLYLYHLLDEYEHKHFQMGTDKTINVKEYMRKYPQVWEQIKLFEKFIADKKTEIMACPKFVLHIAANYSKLERIQQNAKAELDKEPWIEDLTAVPETHCISKNLCGYIRSMDLSPDGKTVAAVTKDEDYNVKLHIIIAQTGEYRVQPIDIKSLNDRVGLLAKFMPDSNIFVGSLTTFVSKQGNLVPSGLDATTVNLKEKYSIEGCDVSTRHFGLGLTTFPWGGRSLHLSVYDLKTKKSLNTIEILRFRFGGSSQFCIKSIAMAKERPLICACFKQSNKPQLRVVVWNITKFQVVNSIDVNNDDITKCLFIGDNTLLLGSGIRSTATTKSSVPNIPVVSEYWSFKEVTNKSSHPWDASEQYSLFAGNDDITLVCRWYSAGGNAVIEQWKGDDIKGKPVARYSIRGLNNVSEMQISNDALLFAANEELFLFSVADLEPVDSKDDTRIPNLSEIVIDSLVFQPKSDTAIITAKRDDYYNVYLCDLSKSEPYLVPTFFEKILPAECSSVDGAGQFSIFHGPTSSAERCFPSADGNYLIFNSGDHIMVLDCTHNTTKNIPSLKDLNQTPVYKEYEAVKAIASIKDNFLAVVYGQIPNHVFLFDVRSCNLLRKIGLDGEARAGIVTDFAFMPANGFLLTYHREKDNMLIGWNSRTGEKMSEEKIHISYAKTSPALDRVVISTKKSRSEGRLILRNADNKFFKKLQVGENKIWLCENRSSDVEFSQDGTILVGVCQEAGVCRVWNAANAEVLLDLPAQFIGPTDVVGMITNTHILFHDSRLIAMDVASGDLIAVLPLDHQVERRYTTRGLRISPKGSVVSGATSGGNLCVFNSHNFATVKRKTTLQRMKSFRK